MFKTFTITLTIILSVLQVLLIRRFTGYIDISIILAVLSLNFIVIALFAEWLSKDLFINKDEKTSSPEESFSEDTYLSADPTVEVVHETLQYMRRGLNETTARKTAEIIQKICEIPAVAITDKEKVLAYLGAGCENHKPGDRIITSATKYVVATGEHKVVNSTEELNCPKIDCNCPLSAGIIAPLKCGEEVIGTLKLYQTKDGQMPPQIVRLGIGLAQLLSIQVELAKLDHQSQLVTEAKLDALHAQINPHFLFNTLNTIIMYSRTDPDKSRQLLVYLSEFFRKTLKRSGHFISLEEELDCVKTYFALEKARFGKKIQIIEDVDRSLLNHPIPIFSLQPLVENAVKHGITPKDGDGKITICAKEKNIHVNLSIIDNGVGIPADRLNKVLQPGYGSGNGVGLSNVHLRLQNLYSRNQGLKIISSPGKGTAIHMQIPFSPDEKSDEHEFAAEL